MGLWWQNVQATQPVDQTESVTFKGDPRALSKRWPILWRFFQNWHIIRITGSTSFSLYFRSKNGQCMKFRKLIFSDYVAVRIGPEEVTFWAVSRNGDNLLADRTDGWIPGRFRKDTRGPVISLHALQLSRQADFI